jgi:hypothetical protein
MFVLFKKVYFLIQNLFNLNMHLCAGIGMERRHSYERT